MGKIADISHHQGSIDWSKASKELDLVIIRVQYGSTTIDTRYKEYVAGAKKYGVPFGHYAYARFVSVADAIVEAKDFMKRADKDAKFLVVDVEEQTCKNPKDIIPATQAFIDTCKKEGWKVGLYTGHHFYEPYGMSKVKADFLWIPRYGAKPAYACDIWQYTETGKLAGVSGNVDLNRLNGSKSLAWFIGEDKKETPKPADKPTSKPKEKAIGEAVIKVDALNIRAKANLNSKDVGTVLKGQKFPVYEKKGDFLRIGKDKWISNAGNKYVTYTANSSKTTTTKPSTVTHKVVSGDTLSGLAVKYKTTVSAIKSLNGLKSDTIYVGQTLKISGTASTTTKPTSTAKYHTVVKGDVVSKLASKYGSTIQQIKDWNKLDKNYTIYVGQKLRVK